MATLTLPPSLQSKLTSFDLKTGLIIGYQNELRYFCLSLSPTPNTEIPVATSLTDLLKSQLQTTDTTYSDWILEHARQAQRMLPSGISVLGLFVCSSDEQLTDYKQKPVLLRNLITLAEEMNRDILQRETVLVMHCWPERQKITCRMIDPKDTRINVVETKTAILPKLEEIRGIYKFDAHFSALNFTVKESVEKILTNFAAKLNTEKVLISRKNEGALPALRSETDVHTVTILSTGISSYLSHMQPPIAQVSVSGTIETRTLVLPKTNILQAADLVRCDLVQSLKYRLSLYKESLDDDGGFFSVPPSESSEGKYGLPYRVFYQTDSGVPICDYLFPEEKTEESIRRVMDLTAFTGLKAVEATEQPIKTVRSSIQTAVPAGTSAPEAVVRDKTSLVPWWGYVAGVVVLLALFLGRIYS